MFKSYLKIALRSLRSSKGYTALNLLGLAVGMASFVLILRYVGHELAYDRFHAAADRTYRVVQRQPGNLFLGVDRFAVTPAPLAGALAETFPEVEAATAMGNSSGLLSAGGRHFFEEGLRADAQFFDVFTFPLLRGDPETALAEPNAIVLTSTLAARLFGDADPVGQTLLFQNRDTYTVTGVVRDVPAASHLRFTYLTSILTDRSFVQNQDNWSNSSWYAYFVLRPGYEPATLEPKLAALLQQHRTDDADNPAGLPRLYLEPLTSIHLHSRVNFDVGVNGDVRYVYLFSAVGVVILLLACVNYTNLAVARSIKRAKEVGLRKVVGASRTQLVVQYLGESVLMALVALGLGLALAHLALPAFEQWMERDLSLDYTDGAFVAELAGLGLLVGLVAGGYPAFVLTTVGPASVLKGSPERTFRRSRLRSLLFVGQYAAAIVLGVGSLVVYQQLRYIQGKDPGYEREHVVVVTLRDPQLGAQVAALKAEFLRDPNVVAVTRSTSLPVNVTSSSTIDAWEGSQAGDEVTLYQLGVDDAFLDVFQVEMAAGRMLSPAHPSDTSGAVLLNETAARRLGWGSAAEAVGRQLTRWGGQAPVVGVVKDFHLHAMHQPIAPLLLYLDPDWGSNLSVRVRPGDVPGTLAHLEGVMKQFSPFPFEYTFLDEAFDRLYQTEVKLGQSFTYFTLLALLIASLGLFGLAAFAAEQRTKEIGVRKVLGATVAQLVLLLAGQFTRLVLVSFVLAAPVAYFLMNRWLDDFTYRITLSWPVFVAAGAAAFTVAFLTVSYQAVRTALLDPVQALRYE